VGGLEGVEDRPPLALRERFRVVAVGQEHRLAQLQRTLLQRAGAAPQPDQPLSQRAAA